MTVDTGDKTSTHQRVTWWLLLTIFGAVLGSAPYGYNLGVINAPELLINDFIKESYYRRHGSHLSESATRNIWALIVSIFAIGGCFGGILAGRVATTFGRNRGCLLNVSLGVVAFVLMFISRIVDSFEVIAVARFIFGCHCGLYNGLVPMYLSEISTSSIRGGVGVVHQIGIVTGLLLGQILGYPVLLGTSVTWHILLGLGLAPCVLQALILPFCPESPRYLLLNRHDEVKCRQALMTLRGRENVDLEIVEIKQEMTSAKRQVGICQLFRTASLRRPLMIATGLQISLHFSGVGGIFFYSTSLFRAVTSSQTVAAYTTSSVGCTMFVMAVLTIPLMDKLGRRPSQLIGLGGISICGVLITLTLIFKDHVVWFPAASIVCVLLYVTFFTIGPGGVAWLMSAELFSHDARPAAMSVCVLINSLSNFVVGIIFPNLQNALKDFVFLPFSILVLLFFVLTFLYVPETKGKSFEEVTAIWLPESGSGKKTTEDSEQGNSSDNSKIGITNLAFVESTRL